MASRNNVYFDGRRDSEWPVDPVGRSLNDSWAYEQLEAVEG